MSIIIDVCLDAVLDTVKLIPFLFLTYFIMEYLEHRTKAATQQMVQKAGRFGPLTEVCWAHFHSVVFRRQLPVSTQEGVISVGTLLAIFLSTSDEMLPIFISESVAAGTIFKILGLKVVIGAVSGFAIDFLWRVGSRKRAQYREHHHKHHEHHEKGIHELCEHAALPL